MESSWAQVIGLSPRTPTPQQRLEAFATFCRSQSDKNTLLEALGARSQYLPGMPAIAIPLVPHMMIICIDTESSTNNTDLLTEVGFNVFKRRDGRTAAPNPGPYGVNVMKLLQFFHFRVVEHAHLLSDRKDSKGPLGNRFGHTRFATFAELRVILHHLFNQPVKSDDPALKGCMQPIVLVGHALQHDVDNGRKEGLGYDFASNHTIVARVDTQVLARTLGVWAPPPDMRTNEIGLRVLVEEKAGFRHDDSHTACNDAARTMICVIWMLLPLHLKVNQPLTMQEVADYIEVRSKTVPTVGFGTEKCCTLCSGRDHWPSNCNKKVVCSACAMFHVGSDHNKHSNNHIETHCPNVAVFKAWARRYRDAYMKWKRSDGSRPLRKEALAGPGAGAHPWSTWTGTWPMKDQSEVVEQLRLKNEPLSSVINLQAALNGLPLPSTGEWVIGRAYASSIASSSAVLRALTPTSNKASMLSFVSALPAHGGRGHSMTAYHPPPTAPVAAREVKMSEQRARVRGERSLVPRNGPGHNATFARRRYGSGGEGAAASEYWDTWEN